MKPTCLLCWLGTNQQGDRRSNLFVDRTVEKHVERILSKTGAMNRTALAKITIEHRDSPERGSAHVRPVLGAMTCRTVSDLIPTFPQRSCGTF